MANEITSLTGDVTGNYQLLFLYAISTPIVWFGTAVNVVPTPSSGLPAVVGELVSAGVIAQAELDALDAGTSAYEIIEFQSDELNGAGLQTRAREIYLAHETAFNLWYAAAYKYPGRRIDKA